MSGTEPEGSDGPSPSELERIGDACARFEAAWRRGDRPRIEDELEVPDAGDDLQLGSLIELERSLRSEAGEEPDAAEYLARFPGSRGMIEALFAGGPPPPQPPDATGAGPDSGSGGSSRSLLVGILALQNGFLTHLELIAAIQEWARDKSRPIGSILVESGRLDARTLALLEAMAAEHRRRRGGLRGGLAAFGSLAPVLRAFEGVDDPDLAEGLAEGDDATRTGLAETTARDEEETTARDPGEGSPGESPGPRAASGTSADRFQILGFHDAGQLGKVFLALDRELHRRVALKEIQDRHAHHPVNRKQFILEGLVTGALEHPGIVPVYSLGSRDDGSPFYAMRFIQGPSLRDKIQQLHGREGAKALAEGEEPPTLPRLLRHFVHACQAMAYAHNRGVLHRDLKPEHVLLGPFGETLVVDWGLAMSMRRGPAAGDDPDDRLHEALGSDSAYAEDGILVGTPPYMSPEQARGEHSKLDQASDVYALGSILYALLTGRAPYGGKDFSAVLSRVRKGEFAPPREVRREAPAALEAICLKAMAFRPEDRYGSALELARDVERWLDDEPTLAYPEPMVVRAGRWLRRHRTAATAAATLVGCTIVGLAALNVQARRDNALIQQERDREIVARKEAVAARESEQVARREAEANFRDSLRVVQKLMLPTAAEALPQVPGTTALRRTVANEATRFLEGLWKQKPEDPEVRRAAASGYRELANILRLLGRSDGAAYRRALNLLHSPDGSRPDDPSACDALAETLQDYAGSLQIEGKAGEAGQHLQAALELTTALRERFADAPEYRRTEARLANNLAYQRLCIGEFAEAARLAEAASRAMAGFADSENSGPTDGLETVLYLDTLGEALIGLGRAEEAEEALDRAIARADALLAKGRDDDVALGRSHALMNRARAQAARPGRRDDARASADAAVAGFERLLRDSPEVVHYPELLAEAYLARALIHLQGEGAAEARADLERALGHAETLLAASPSRPAYASLAGRIVGRLGLLDARAGANEASARLTRAAGLLRTSLAANDRHPHDRKALAEIEGASAPKPDAPG